MAFGRNKFKVSAPDQRTWQGKTYASKAEMVYARDGIIREDVIAVFEQVPVWLSEARIKYVPDFLIIPKDSTPYFVDVKGVETEGFRKNKKLWKAYGQIPLEIVKAKYKKGGIGGFKVVETIVPEAA